MLEEAQFRRMTQLLRQTSLRDDLILVGSAALYLMHTAVPPQTTDADFLVATSVLASKLEVFRSELHRLGFHQVEDTATFVHSQGDQFDLLALVEPGEGDKVVHLPGLSMMAFEDLAVVASRPGAVRTEAELHVLSPAALIFSKLRTWRLEKGVKDKLQALALLGEKAADADLVRDLQAMARDLSVEDWEDLVADAQAAFVGLEGPGALGYADFAEWMARGYEALLGMRSG